MAGWLVGWWLGGWRVDAGGVIACCLSKLCISTISAPALLSGAQIPLLVARKKKGYRGDLFRITTCLSGTSHHTLTSLQAPAAPTPSPPFHHLCRRHYHHHVPTLPMTTTATSMYQLTHVYLFTHTFEPSSPCHPLPPAPQTHHHHHNIM